MAGKLDLEARMTIKTLKDRGSSASSIGRTLGVTEGSVRYHLRRQAARAVDGRARTVFRVLPWSRITARRVQLGVRDLEWPGLSGTGDA